MKKIKFILFAAVLLMFGCKNYIKGKTLISEPHSQNYTGPIIDMHIHAYSEGNPLFGMTHPPTLRGKTYKGVSSAIEHKEKTLEKFRQHNIVKAMITNGELWKDQNDGLILIGRTDKIDALKNLFRDNELNVIAEMAPFYPTTTEKKII